jgi:plastocyanin
MVRPAAIAAVAVAMFAGLPAASAAEPRPKGGDGATVGIKVADNSFRPKKLEVVAGTTVRWTNRGRNEHDVVPNKGVTFGIDELAPGQTYSFQFIEPGRYAYYCSFHGAPGAGQHATIKVVKRRERGAK